MSRLLVDLDALAANHAALREVAGVAEVAPVVKADGYGLGAAVFATRLFAEGARRFFVARLAEGEALRQALGEREAVIYVLDGCAAGDAARLDAAALIPVLSSLPQVDAWAHGAPRAGRPAALHVDTGMNRLGLAVEEAHALARSNARLGRVEITHVMSHLACADEPGSPMNPAQLARFREVRSLFPHARASLANSAGAHLGMDYAFDAVRPGIGLYGAGPGAPRAVATFEAAVLQLRTVRAGESIGYGATYVADRTLTTATLEAGYADGVLRALSGRGYAFWNGRRLPILGRVSMDLLVLDASDAPGLAPGDPVQLVGPEVPLRDVAAAAGTIAYEVLTRLAPRTPRTYLGARG